MSLSSAGKPTGGSTGDQRLRYKSALVETLRRDGGDFHVVAQLRAGASRAALGDALYAWVARVNRSYLGRSWSGTAPCQGSYEGIPPRSPCCPSTCHRLFPSLHAQCAILFSAQSCCMPPSAVPSTGRSTGHHDVHADRVDGGRSRSSHELRRQEARGGHRSERLEIPRRAKPTSGLRLRTFWKVTSSPGHSRWGIALSCADRPRCDLHSAQLAGLCETPDAARSRDEIDAEDTPF